MQYSAVSGTGLSALVGTQLAIPSKADRQICIDMMPVAQNNIWMSKAAQARLSNRSYARQCDTNPPLFVSGYRKQQFQEKVTKKESV